MCRRSGGGPPTLDAGRPGGYTRLNSHRRFPTDTVRAILARKGNAVVSVAPDSTVLDAARIMGDNGFGAVLVTDGGALVGIFTERDTLRRVVAVERDPAATRIADVMTSSLFTCLPDTTIAECSAIMTTHHIRHLPVVGEQGLLGLVSIGDLLAFRVREQEATIEYLNSYMFDVR